MKTKKLWRLFAALAVLFALAACPQGEDDETAPPSQKHGPWGSPAFSGTKTDSENTVIINEQGQPVPGRVNIQLRLEDGIITEVTFNETTGQSDSPGMLMIGRAPALIIEKNSLDISRPDAISKCTITLNAIKAAGNKALRQIPGVE